MISRSRLKNRAAVLSRAAVLAAAALWIGTLPAQGQTFPGTQPLTLEKPLDEVMVEGLNQFALRELQKSPSGRSQYWKRDYAGAAVYEASIAPNRARFLTIIGAVDPRVPPEGLELVKMTEHDSRLAEAPGYEIHQVRWPVFKGVSAEGLLLQPRAAPRARVVALPDADWTPEMLAGLQAGSSSQLARRLAEQGFQVLVPTLINRQDTLSGNPDVRFTNQPHREFIYRQAFQMGRHLIGYEVQKVMAAVDQFVRWNGLEQRDLSIGVAGIGEGALLAFYSAAADPRIDAALVSGYFQPREGLWEEPIYRNVWSLLREFGDAEIAGLIAPRALTVEAASAPEIAGPPEPQENRRGAAPGRIATPDPAGVQAEFERARVHFDKLRLGESLTLVRSGDGRGPAGSDGALSSFLKHLGASSSLAAPAAPAQTRQALPDDARRQKRQFDELVEFTQRIFRASARARDQFWSKADRSSVQNWEQSAEFYRNYVWDEMIGRLPEPTSPLQVRTRQVLDEPGYLGYEVVIDVHDDVIASGILLMPKDIRPGERRPVVVCQHGLEGVPMDTITREGRAFEVYAAFSHEIANRGFIAYAPQNPYRGRDLFRTIQRKSNPLKRSLFSYILAQHARTLEWLSSLPQVDPQRIGFYGLSYGGKTAVRVPPLLKQYALSICSADYNEWILKNVSVTDRYSYMFTGEYEMFEWNMGHVANYAELANLMTPRPFMVERGHNDGVAPDEWVAWEYAKVRRHYNQIGIGGKTEIEFFDGPHKINGVETYEFLHRHLNWPKKAAAR